MLRELKFSIANHTFWYTYEIPFELPLDSPINNFRIGDYTNYDTKNSIRFNAALLEYRKWKADFETPAWSYYDSEKIFLMHPNKTIVGEVKLINGFRDVITTVNSYEFLPQPAPICVTGLLLQNALANTEAVHGLIMHGAVINLNGVGLVLTGNSGVGKSTLSRLLRENTSCKQISDDRFILIMKENEFYGWGNPFDTKIERNLNIGAKIEIVFFLKHGKNNNAKKIEKSEILERLIKISLLPYWNKIAVKSSILLLKR